MYLLFRNLTLRGNEVEHGRLMKIFDTKEEATQVASEYLGATLNHPALNGLVAVYWVVSAEDYYR